MSDPVPASRLWLWRIWTTIGVLVLVVAAWRVLRGPLAIIVPPLALAAVLVYVLNPVVRLLSRVRVPRVLSTFSAYAVLVVGLVVLVRWVGPVIADQTGELVERLPEITEDLQRGINQQLARAGVSDRLAVDLQSPATQDAIQGFLEENRDSILNVLVGALGFVGRVFHLLLTVVLAPILAFYILADLPRLERGVERLLPPASRGEVVDVSRRIGRAVGGYFRGQLLVATFVGVASATGLAIVGLPFWAIVGVFAGVTNLIPLIGPFVGGAIGIIVALTVGDGGTQALWVAAIMVAVQQVDNHLISPAILSRTVEVHPLTVILGLLVAGSLYGLLGMLVAIPIIAAVKLVLMYLLVTRVPSMRHLAGDGPGLFPDDGEEEPRSGTLVALGREMRRTWERRRPAAEVPRERGESGSATSGGGTSRD
ncbi:MAG: AI-2E family transporter [Actinobacteria bacterium]|nr:AI-2E family transporter [Actinomycetota bacterium]